MNAPMYPGGMGYSNPPRNYGYSQPQNYQNYNGQQPMQQPYQNPYASQAMLPPPEPPSNQIPATLINAIEDMKPNEVPSDGSPALSLSRDKSCIYLRELTQNGTIATYKYVYVDDSQTANEPDPANSILEPVMRRLDALEDMIRKQNRPRKKTKYYPNQQKGQQKP